MHESEEKFRFMLTIFASKALEQLKNKIKIKQSSSGFKPGKLALQNELLNNWK